MLFAAAILAAPLQAQTIPGLAAWWPGEGNPQDLIGTNHGTLMNGASFGAGILGQGFVFDGVNDYVSIPDSDLWAFGTNDFTVELWARFNSVRQSDSLIGADFVFVGTSEGPGENKKWAFFMVGGVTTFLYDTPPLHGWLAQHPFLPTTNQWYHLAVSRSGSLYTIYVDGVPVSWENSGDAVPNARVPLTIGQFEGIGFMDGLLDEMSIYSRALTPAEIQAIYVTNGRYKYGDAGSWVSPSPRSLLVREDAGVASVNVLLLRDPRAPEQTVTVDYATVDDTARAGQDYGAVSGTLQFAPGETNKLITIPILHDTREEPEEQFRLVLSNATSGVSLGNSNVVIRIQDNELLFYDDFESYPTNSFPGNGWTLVYEGAGADMQRVEPPPSGRTGKALHLNGVPYWVARAYQPIEFPPKFAMEAVLYAVEGGGFGGYNPDLGPWGDHYAAVGFSGRKIEATLRVYRDLGEIDVLTVPLVPYVSNTWYRVRTVVDLTSRSFDVYLDGELIGQGLPIMEPGLPLGVEVSSGASFWVDDVKVVSTVPPPPLNLQLKSTFRPAGTNAVHVVDIANTRALIGTDEGITHLLDIADPAKPALLGTWQSLVNPSALCLRSNLAFIAGWEFNFLSTVEVVDFADPAHPVLRDFFDTPGYVRGLAVTDRHVFVADDEAGLIILDRSNPAALREIGRYPTHSSVSCVAVAGNFAYLGLEGGLIILDVTDPARPTRAGVWASSNAVRDVAVQGTTVFILEVEKGLKVLDVRQPSSPLLVGSNAWVMDAMALDVAGDFVFLANGTRGLQVIDASNPAKPEWVTGYATTGLTEDVVVSGNQVWLAAGSQGLLGLELVNRRLKFEGLGGPGSAITLSWQANAGWRLQKTTSLEPTDWQLVPGSETTNRITLPNEANGAFFRLVKP